MKLAIPNKQLHALIDRVYADRGHAFIEMLGEGESDHYRDYIRGSSIAGVDKVWCDGAVCRGCGFKLKTITVRSEWGPPGISKDPIGKIEGRIPMVRDRAFPIVITQEMADGGITCRRCGSKADPILRDLTEEQDW